MHICLLMNLYFDMETILILPFCATRLSQRSPVLVVCFVCRRLTLLLCDSCPSGSTGRGAAGDAPVGHSDRSAVRTPGGPGPDQGGLGQRLCRAARHLGKAGARVFLGACLLGTNLNQNASTRRTSHPSHPNAPHPSSPNAS